MPSRTRSGSQEKRERTHTRTIVEDERGWAGQHGQRPANEEEKQYRGTKAATASSSGTEEPKQE